MKSVQASAAEHDTLSARDLRRQQKIKQIVHAATDVFLDDGFSNASMDRIVEKAGVSKRTLYKYYPSKDEIFIDVMQMQLGTIFENFSPNRFRSMDLEEQLRSVGIELLKLANAPGTLAIFRIIAAEAQRFPKLAQQFFEQSFDQIIEGIATILDRENSISGQNISDTRQAGEYFLDLLTGTNYLNVVFGTLPPMKGKTISLRTERALNYFFAIYFPGLPRSL